MKKPYKHIRLKQRSKEWKQYRHETGIGASEVASALATDSKELAELVYQPPLKLFLEKIDEPIAQFSGNISSEEGTFQEKAIIERFKYYDLESPDQLSIYKRMEDGNQLNGIYNPNCILWNPKFPFLYYSPDSLMTGSIKSRIPIACLESKLTTSMETARYSDKTNPAHYLQVMTGLMITGLPVGYLISLVDGKWLMVTPVNPDKEIFQWIEQTCADFWLRVAQARKIKIEYGIPGYYGVNTDFFTEKQKEGIDMLTQLEPALTGNEREVDFIKEMIIPTPEYTEMIGTQQQWEDCLNYLKVNDDINILKSKKNEFQFSLIKSLGGTHEAKFDDGKSGHFSYKPDKNGKCSLYVSSKIKNL